MGRVRNDSRDAVTGRMTAAFAQRPDDFERTFVLVGRVGCEGHYHVGRRQVNAWLDECGKESLIELRAQFVKRKEEQRREAAKLNRRDMRVLLREAYRPPIRGRAVSITLARAAAQHLRIRRNGGWIVSPCPNGDWRVGTRRVSAAQLVDMAKRTGFNPSLTVCERAER